MFDSVGSLFKWFKEHFRDPIPGGATPGTPRPGHNAFGSATPNINSEYTINLNNIKITQLL